MYTPKDYSSLIGTPGFSEAMLRNHFTLYEGYVKNTNALAEKLSALAHEEVKGPEYAELTRRFGWEWNGMRLHELYFGNLKNGGAAHDPDSSLCATMKEVWGSCDAWAAEFRTLGTLRGIGWVLLVRDGEGSLRNIWVNEHDIGHLVGATPILVMDVFEHAFMLDYGLKRSDYIAAFWKAVDWPTVQRRYDDVQ